MRVTKQGDANYNAATSATISITVDKIEQAPLTAIAALSSIPYNGTTTLRTTGGSGTGAVTYSVASGAANCSISGTTVKGTGVGPCTLVATKAPDVNYTQVTSTAIPISVVQATQIALTAPVATPSTVIYGGTTTLSTTGGSGTGAVSFALTSGATNCAISGTTLTGIRAGNCSVVATKASDGNYLPATSTARTITVGKAPQAALAALAASPTIARGGTTTLSTTGGSGTGSVSYSLVTGGTSCSMSGKVLKGTAVGSCTVVANKLGDTNFLQAASAPITINVL